MYGSDFTAAGAKLIESYFAGEEGGNGRIVGRVLEESRVLSR